MPGSPNPVWSWWGLHALTSALEELREQGLWAGEWL